MVEAFQNFLDKAEIETQNQIEVRLIELLKEKHLTLALAESLTGGMISSRITSVPGSSEYFIGSVVCYHPRIKVQYCGVDAKSISQFGAVSEVVAREMAVGIKKRFGTSIGLGITGAAGPTPHGGAPVGKVWLAVAKEEGEVKTKEYTFDGGRESIRKKAAEAALGLLWFEFGQLEI